VKNTRVVGRVAILLLTCATIMSCGCDLADQPVLNGFRKYFPAAYLLKIDNRILWVQTDVTNVSRAFADETFRSFMAKPEAIQLKQLLPIAGYQVMVLGFADFDVIWMPQQNLYWALSLADADVWSQQFLGYRFSTMKPLGLVVR
jgi:hypothetical protein